MPLPRKYSKEAPHGHLKLTIVDEYVTDSPLGKEDFQERVPYDLFQVTTADENDIQPTKWAKESSPGQSDLFLASDALGHRISPTLPPQSGTGSPPAPDRGGGLFVRIVFPGRRGWQSPTGSCFSPAALGYSPMAFQAIFIQASHAPSRSTT